MKNKKDWERRSYTFEIRTEELDGEKIISGRPIVYESKTDMLYYAEIIKRGALDGADLRDVRFLVNHDTKRIPLARSRRNNGNSTMYLQPDFEGMSIRVSLDTENNADARALYSAVKRGDITGMSFAFSVESEKWYNLESDYPTREIEKIGRVVEVSAVTFPAYQDTTISAREKETVEKAREEVRQAREADKKKNDELVKEKLRTLVKIKSI